MTDLEKAARMALEAICGSADFLFNWHDCEPNNEREMQAYQAALEANERAFNALRRAIEQAEQAQPVDWEAVAADQAMTIAMMKAERKPWVGLTWDDMPDSSCGDPAFLAGAQWANSKLKEKNA